MKRLFSSIVGVVLLASLITTVFVFRQIGEEKALMLGELESRTSLLSEGIKASLEPVYEPSILNPEMQSIVERFTSRVRLTGIAIYTNKSLLLAASPSLPREFLINEELLSDAMDADMPQGRFQRLGNGSYYLYADPLHQNDRVAGSLLVVQNADYIDRRIAEIWRSNLARLLIQALAFSVAVFVILRLTFFQTISRLTNSLKSLRSGGKFSETEHEHEFFKPLTREIRSMTKSLVQARSAASQEARMRLEKLDTAWTAERLKEFIRGTLKNNQLYVVSNREPYIHDQSKQGIKWHIPAGGVVTALDAVMEACGGLWIAHGSGSADRETVGERNIVRVPPDEPKYDLKRIWLTPQEQKGYYEGFSNEALWPLMHMAHTRPTFRKSDWLEYRRVNAKFAKALLEEIKGVNEPLILAQDYHMALLPYIIKKARPDAKIALFWHIPWISPEVFSICPWRKEILQGMLGADIIGFQIQQYGNNFMDTVRREIEAQVDFEQFSVTREGHISYIKPFPVSVPFTGDNSQNPDPEYGYAMLSKLGIGTEFLAVGVDRMDYTKGLIERFHAVEYFLDSYPVYAERFTLLQIASPSREGVARYRQFSADVTAEAERINKKFSRKGWQPIVLLKEHFSHREIYALYRIANLCMVTALHDGMNLVAKEFVAAQAEENGVLILSQFNGAVRELKQALIVNPYNAEETGEAIRTALTMSGVEKRRRMRKMRETVKNYNIYRWSAELIKAVADIG